MILLQRMLIMYLRGLHLSPGHLEFTGLTDEGLGYVNRVSVPLGESKRHIDLALGSSSTDALHFWAVDLE